MEKRQLHDDKGQKYFTHREQNSRQRKELCRGCKEGESLVCLRTKRGLHSMIQKLQSYVFIQGEKVALYTEVHG